MVDAGLTAAREDYAEELGWPELAATVDRVAADPRVAAGGPAAVLTVNYGEAGAVERFGRTPLPVFSTDATWRWWPPVGRAADARTLVAVGFHRPWLEANCLTFRHVATITNRWDVDNEEHGQPVSTCRLRQPLGRLWTALPRSG
jgi:hypothetical protein